MSGWYAVSDQVPGKGGVWATAKHPMRGVRWLEMEPTVGYLAVRWDKCRYIFEGVPERKYDMLRRHKGAGIYFRQQIKGQYPCVDIKIYETLEAYRSDELQEAIESKRERLAIQQEPQTSQIVRGLFGPMPVILGPCQSKRKRGTKSS